MIAFIDDHRQEYGVEPICRVLPIAPSTYHGHAAKRRDPSRLSNRAKRDETLKIEVKRVFFGRDPSAQREWATRAAHQLIVGQSRAPSL